MADIGPSNERSPLLQRQRRSESEERPETETYELFITIPISRTTALSLGVFLSVLFSSSLHGLSLAYLPLPRYRQLGNPLYWERMILTTCSLPVGCIGALLGAGNVNQYGIRKLYILALSTLTFGAALIVVAPTWPIFIFARIVQSIACGPVMSLATATFVKMHAVEERGSMIGYLQLAYIVGLGYSVGVGTGGCEYSVSPSLNCSGFAGYRAPVPWRFYAFVIAASVGVLALWLRKSLPQDTVAASDDGGRTHAYQVRTPSVNIFLAIYELMKRPRVFLISIISGVPLVYLPSILTMYLNNSDIHDWTNLAVGWYSSCVYLIGAIVGAGLGGSSSDKAVRSRMPHSSPADRLRVPSIATSLFIPLSFIGLFACCLVPFISPKDREAAIGLVTITVSLFLGIATGEIVAVALVYVAESGRDDQSCVCVVVANELVRLVLPAVVIGTGVVVYPSGAHLSRAVDSVIIYTVSVLSVVTLGGFRWVARGSATSVGTVDEAEDGTAFVAADASSGSAGGSDA